MPLLFWLAFAILWIIVLIQGFAFLEVVRQLADIREGTDSLRGPRLLPDTVSVGEELPIPESLRHADTGDPVEWPSIIGREATALVLLHPGCATCYTVSRDVRRVANSQRTGRKVIPIVSAYSPERAEDFIRETLLPKESVLVEVASGEDNDRFAKALNVNRKPAAVVLRGSKIAAAATVLNGDHLDILLDSVLQEQYVADGKTSPEETSLVQSTSH
jgi:hypothetical protein